VQTDPCRTLVQVLREEFGLTGTKSSCNAGECGVCTVLIDGDPVPSCIVPIGKVSRRHVLTIEGLRGDRILTCLQGAFVEKGAIQCGYCTPGMLLTSRALLEWNTNPSELEVRTALSGNICRCTGYTKILEAVFDAARALQRGGENT